MHTYLIFRSLLRQIKPASLINHNNFIIRDQKIVLFILLFLESSVKKIRVVTDV